MNHENSTAESPADIVLVHGVGRAVDNGRMARLARRAAASSAGSRHVVDAWLVGTAGDRLMFMLADSVGHHTQSVDLATFAAWLNSNHPEIYDGKGDSLAGAILALDLQALAADVLEGALAHCRAQRVATAAAVIVGHLSERESPFMQYSEAGWGSSAGGAFW